MYIKGSTVGEVLAVGSKLGSVQAVGSTLGSVQKGLETNATHAPTTAPVPDLTFPAVAPLPERWKRPASDSSSSSERSLSDEEDEEARYAVRS